MLFVSLQQLTCLIARNVGVHFVQGDRFVLAQGYMEALMHGQMRFTFFAFFSRSDADEMICAEFHPLL